MSDLACKSFKCYSMVFKCHASRVDNMYKIVRLFCCGGRRMPICHYFLKLSAGPYRILFRYEQFQISTCLSYIHICYESITDRINNTDHSLWKCLSLTSNGNCTCIFVWTTTRLWCTFLPIFIPPTKAEGYIDLALSSLLFFRPNVRPSATNLLGLYLTDYNRFDHDTSGVYRSH